MLIYGFLGRAAFESLTSNPSAGTTARFWWNSTDGRAYFDKTSVNRAFLLNDDKIILGNSGTAAENVRLHRGAAGVLQFVPGGDTTVEGTLATSLNQISARVENYTDAAKPTPGQAGRIAYITDLQTFLGDNGTTWVSLGGGGGGGALQWIEEGVTATPAVENFIRTYQFVAGQGQSLYALVRVPDSYSAGRQIRMKMPVYSPDASGTVLFQTVATLIRKEVDAVTSTANQRTSTNAAITLGAGTVDEPQEVSFDLTSTAGEINGVAVTKGDLIVVRLTRGTDTATSDARALPFGAEVLTS